MKKLVFFFWFLISPSIFAVGYNDWMTNIDSSCTATIRGKLGSSFSKYGFWFDTAVSMDMWAENMQSERPEEYCHIEYGLSSSKPNQAKLMQCVAYIKNNWDWYRRCKPVVNLLSRQEANARKK